jgi:Glycosyltransferase family 87
MTDDDTAPAAIAKVGRIDTTSPAPAATITQRLAPRLNAAAPVLLMLSVAARLAWTYLVPNGANFVDLHVYLGGAAAIDHPGTLYSYVYADQTADFPLPFTYPPFAAVVFYPLHLLPFGLVAFVWQIAMMAALYGAVRVSQRLLGVPSGAGHRVDRAAAQQLRLWAGQCFCDAGGALGGLLHALVGFGAAGGRGVRDQVDAGNRRCLSGRRPALWRSRVFGGRVPCHRRDLGFGCRR